MLLGYSKSSHNPEVNAHIEAQMRCALYPTVAHELYQHCTEWERGKFCAIFSSVSVISAGCSKGFLVSDLIELLCQLEISQHQCATQKCCSSLITLLHECFSQPWETYSLFMKAIFGERIQDFQSLITPKNLIHHFLDPHYSCSSTTFSKDVELLTCFHPITTARAVLLSLPTIVQKLGHGLL